MGLGGQRLNPAARPQWQCWGPRAVAGATEWGEDAVRGKRDCQWPARTGADDMGWRVVTQDAWEERQTERQAAGGGGGGEGGGVGGDPWCSGAAPEDSVRN